MRLTLTVVALVAGAATAADGVRIRAAFAPGQDLHYRWHLEATNEWAPTVPGTDSGTMRTDFDFHLVAEDQGFAEGEGNRRSGEICGSRLVSCDGIEDGALAGVRLPGENEFHACSASIILRARLHVSRHILNASAGPWGVNMAEGDSSPSAKDWP